MILRRLIIFSMLFIWILSELLGSVILPRMRRKGVNIKNNDEGSKTGLMVGVIASIIVASLMSSNGEMPEGVYIVGVGVMIIGIIVRQWSIAVLGCYFSGSVGIQEGQDVIDKGPYGLIRHPAYTGTIVTVLGYAVIQGSILGIFLVILICAVVYNYRINIEEKLLVSELGDSYLSYMKRTKKIIPYIL